MNKVKRDQLILRLLTKFKVLSRNQIAYLTCSINANPVNVANRVLRRMYLDGKILQVQRGRSETFLYMPNPSILHPRSIKIDHQLKIVDFYIHAGCPATFIPEPPFKNYKPDVYMKNGNGDSICVEIQLTPISSKRMQKKVDEFVSTYGKEHDARIMLLVSNTSYNVHMPDGFHLRRIPIPTEKCP